jgi:general stress protein YciG
VPDEKRSFSQNPELAAEAGRKGGQASHGGGATDGQAKAAAPRSPEQD